MHPTFFTNTGMNAYDRRHEEIGLMQPYTQTSHRGKFKNMLMKHNAIITPRTDYEVMETVFYFFFCFVFFAYIIVKLEHCQLKM